MGTRKYKLVRLGLVPYFSDTLWGQHSRVVYRIKALRDIPLYGVKKGDLGGEVTSISTLSQEGECWIGAQAQVFGTVFVTDDAYIGEKAFVSNDIDNHSIKICGKARIQGSARVTLDTKIMSLPNHSLITGNVNIHGNAQISNLGFAEGNIDIYGYAVLLGVKQITGVVDICGSANLSSGVTVAGDSRIVENAIVEENATVYNSILRQESRVRAGSAVHNEVLGEEPVYSGYSQTSMKTLKDAEKYFSINILPETSESSIYHNRQTFKSIEKHLYDLDEVKSLNNSKAESELITDFLNQIARKHGSNAYVPQKALVSNSNTKNTSVKTVASQNYAPEDIEITDAVNLLAEIKNDLLSYESDIVKILQFPVMTDNTDPFTLDMVAALKLTDRLALNPSHKRFVASVFDLEKKFLAAESNARRIASTRLTTGEKKGTDRARDLISIAADEASSEQEKKVAFKQAFKQLEGIIAVPDVAVDTFRVKIGLKELETLR